MQNNGPKALVIAQRATIFKNLWGPGREKNVAAERSQIRPSPLTQLAAPPIPEG